MLKLSFPTPSVEDSGNYKCTALFSNTLTLEAEVRVDFYGKYPDDTFNIPKKKNCAPSY